MCKPGYPSQQCAAVTTLSAATSEPPHMSAPPGPPRSTATRCGNSPGSASAPPTIPPRTTADDTVLAAVNAKIVSDIDIIFYIVKMMFSTDLNDVLLYM